MSPDLKRYAQFGAYLRLQQLDTERKAILAAFPDLRVRNAAATGSKPRRRMSHAARLKLNRARLVRKGFSGQPPTRIS